MKKLSGIVGAILFLLGGILLLAGRSFVIPAFSKPVDIMEEGSFGKHGSRDRIIYGLRSFFQTGE